MNQNLNDSQLSHSLQIHLFSQSRLRGYTSTQEHEENLALIASIAHKIGIIEIILRNKLDSILSQNNANWLESLPQEIAREIKPSPEIRHTASKDKIISSQNLGFWIKVVEHYKIHNQILDIDFLDTMDFKKYFVKNKNRFSGKSNLRDYHKVKAILGLLRLIRNRSFHFENLYKLNPKGPRLSVKIINKSSSQSTIISIHPSKIKDFLDDLLASFHKDLVFYAQN